MHHAHKDADGEAEQPPTTRRNPFPHPWVSSSSLEERAVKSREKDPSRNGRGG